MTTISSLPIHRRKPLQVIWLVITGLYLLFQFLAAPTVYDSFQSDAVLLHSQALAEFNLTPDHYAVYFTGLNLILAMLLFAFGFMLFWRRPHDPLALTIALTIATFSIQTGRAAIAFVQVMPDWWPISTGLRVFNGVLILLFFALFPNGKLVPRYVALAYLLFGWTFISFPTNDVRNYVLPETASQWLLVSAIYIFIGLGIQFWRYRTQSTPVERQQTKWVLFGLGVGVTFLMLNALIGIFLTPTLNESPQGRLIYRLLSNTFLVFVPSLFIPLSFFIAIVRHRLWDIDRLINRSLVVILTALGLLIGLLGGIVVIQGLLQDRLGSIPVLALTLGVGASYNPLRHRVQRMIDRRFYRWRFDLDQLSAAERSSSKTQFGVLTGQTLHGYQLNTLIGKGGMGEVYQATKDSQIYAIKTLLANSTPDHAERFKREIIAMSQLQHPNIVRYFGGGTTPIPHLILDYIDGVNLNTYLEQRGRFAPSDALILARGIASALDYAHAQGVIHRDLKPANILLRVADDEISLNPLLLDFGIAKFSNESSLTGTGAIGTIIYMAPEQIESAKQVTHQADSYAFAVVLYEMLTGHPPFQGELASILFAHIQQPPPDICADAPHLPPAVNGVFQRALAKDAQARWPSAGAFIAALSGALA